MEEVLAKIDKKEFDSAIAIITNYVIKKHDAKFIEELVISLNILNENAPNVVKAIIPHLLSILNYEDDVIRYSMIISLEKFIVSHPHMITTYIKDYLSSPHPKDREGMLFLIEYIAIAAPKELTDFYMHIIRLLGDKEDFVRKKATAVLQKIGKSNRNELEVKLIDYIKTQDNPVAKEATDEVLKGIVDIANLEKHELEKLEQEVRQKVLTEKAQELKKTEQELKQLELQKREMELKKKMEEENQQRELLARQKQLQEEEQRIALEKLKLEEVQKELEKKRIEEERIRLEKEAQVLKQQQQLSKVKEEFEKKKIEEERAKIIAEETARIQKKMAEMEKEEDKDDFKDV